RPDPSGYRGDPARFLFHALIMAIANQPVSFFTGFVGYSVNTHIDDDYAFFDHLAFDQIGLPRRNNEYICLYGVRGKVAGILMADCCRSLALSVFFGKDI